MNKERLQQSILGIVVGLSILSFVYVNYFAGSLDNQLTRKELVNHPEESATIDKDDVENEKGGTGPNIAVLVRFFELAKKFVPSGH